MDNRDALAKIAAEAGRGELAFPTHAEVSMRVRRALEDPELHVDAAARLIQAEPVLAARVVAVANSATFNDAGRPFADMRTAAARVGFRTAHSLATALLMQQLGGKAVAPAHRSLSVRLWEHTAHVAALAQVLARRVTRLDPETAMFAGIVHEVGGFYLLSRGTEYPELIEANAQGWQGEGEVIVGRAVLRALSVPEQVSEAMEHYWQGFLAMPPRTLGDTLLLADDLAPVQSPFQLLKDRNGEDVPCEIEMVLGTETLTEILQESAGEVKSLTEALRL
ncbi:MAG: HDOD domain-containing protein [Betaproteobacteria bacterium]|nr:HDOD domain-containing protein [Betaproteobacteria bacterium]